jgi:hypothetical protein
MLSIVAHLFQRNSYYLTQTNLFAPMLYNFLIIILVN